MAEHTTSPETPTDNTEHSRHRFVDLETMIEALHDAGDEDKEASLYGLSRDLVNERVMPEESYLLNELERVSALLYPAELLISREARNHIEAAATLVREQYHQAVEALVDEYNMLGFEKGFLVVRIDDDYQPVQGVRAIWEKTSQKGVTRPARIAAIVNDQPLHFLGRDQLMINEAALDDQDRQALATYRINNEL